MTPIYAQSVNVDKPIGFQITDIGTLVSGTIGVAFLITGIIIFGFIVFGGILMITSSGDKTQTERGRNAISGALVGLGIVAAAWAIMLLVNYFFGVNFTGSLSLPTFY